MSRTQEKIRFYLDIGLPSDEALKKAEADVAAEQRSQELRIEEKRLDLERERLAQDSYLLAGNFWDFISSLSPHIVFSSTGSLPPSSTGAIGTLNTLGFSQESKEKQKSRSHSSSTDILLSDSLILLRDSLTKLDDQDKTNYTKSIAQRKIHCKTITEYNIYFDLQSWPENVIKKDIFFQIENQLPRFNRDKMFQLTNELFRVVLDMKSNGINCKWVVSNGFTFLISSTNKKDN